MNRPTDRVRAPTDPSVVDFTAVMACRDLEVRYGAVVALRGVDLQIAEGGLTAVIGPNGAGKTTLLRTICGLERPSRGEVVLDGQPVGHSTPERMLGHGVVLVPEGRHVFPQLTVADNLRLGAFKLRRDRATVADRTARVYGRFPILAERRDQAAGTLSGGEQQMLAIGRALMSGPRILCLDEPSLGLAPKIVRNLFDLLTGLTDEGVTILLVEQFARLALAAATNAYLLESGHVTREGTGAAMAADVYVQESYLGGRRGGADAGRPSRREG